MNRLNEAFYEYFSPFYYYDNSGRAYIEYSCSSLIWYSWKIGFFHFSLEDTNKNIFFNYKIYKFIKEFYPLAFENILALLEYCTKQGFLLAIISVSDTEFLLRVSWGDSVVRKIISDIYKKNVWEDFNFPHESFTCPIEFHINTDNFFTITSLNVYQKISLPKTIEYKKGYLEEDNLFLTISCQEYNTGNRITQKSYSMKLYEPIELRNSWFLGQEYYHPYIEKTFAWTPLYMNCIERKQNEDIIYFTRDYPIEA